MTDRLRPRETRAGKGVRKRTLYIPASDDELWEWTLEHAKAGGHSLASVVATALAQYREQEEGKHGNDETAT